MSAAVMLRELAAKGILIRRCGDSLDIDAPEAVLTDDLLNNLRENKWELLRALKPEPSELDEDAREHFEERSAIGEYDGGLSRPEAEKQAARRVYEYRLRDDPDTWLLLLVQPGDDLAEARRALTLRFGAERVMDVRRYRPTIGSTGRQEAC